MLRITFLLVIGVLCVGVPALRAEETAGEEAQAKIKALETEVAVLSRALATFQKRFPSQWTMTMIWSMPPA